MSARSLIAAALLCVVSHAGWSIVRAAPASPASGSRIADETPAWYVRKATVAETYEASRRKRAENLAVSFGAWHYLGPFANDRGQGFNTEYPPEKGVDLKGDYHGKAGATIRWMSGERFRDNDVNDLAIFGDNDNFAVYLYRKIQSDRVKDLPVLLGSDDTLTVWLNGKKLLAVNANRTCQLGEDRLTLPLRQGENELLMKVCQGGGPTGFAFGASAHEELDDEALLRVMARDFPDHIDAFSRATVMQAEHDRQFRQLGHDLSRLGWFNGVAKHAYRREALIWESDRDPLDIVLRRTGALLARLQDTAAAAKLGPLAARWRDLKTQAAATDVQDKDARYKLYLVVCGLRRQIAFTNPLLDFDKILFVKRHFLPPYEGEGNHMCDQYFGFHALAGGGVYVLEDAFGSRPRCRDVLADAVCTKGRFGGEKLRPGAFLSPALSWDAKTILFAYTEGEHTRYQWSEKSTWHLFKVDADGSHLVQLTDGPWNDFDPCYLPNDRVAFISERRGGFGRCHGRPVPTYTLHTMNDNGSDITCISYHETNEWHPSVNNEGMIVYTRWDYVDRGHGQAHHPWITSPDGRDARVIQGNYGRSGNARPNMEMSVRAIPGSRKYVATATAHHGQAYGSLVIIDPSVPDDDAMAPLKMLTPETGFPESTVGGDNLYYATAWPLDEDFFLCVYDAEGSTRRGPENRFGLYLIDSFGNRELIYRDANISCLKPIPFRAQKRPPVIPHLTRVGPPQDEEAVSHRPAGDLPETARVGVVNVYDSLKPWPEGTRIKALRIVQVLPKTTPSANNPRIGYGDQKSAREVLGTVPVEADGSAYFNLPVGKPVYFQVLDEKGLAVQSMRSDAYVHPGETLICQGCHAPTQRVASLSKPYHSALRRAPSSIAPDVEGSRPFSYPRLVQPVLDRHCVECHAKNGPKAADLSKGPWEKNPNLWYTSYLNLRPYAYFIEPAGWTEPRTIPGRFGARASKLYPILGKGHYDVNLTPEEMHRLTLWLDCNSDFFGAYEHTREQAEGETVMPTLE